MHNTINRSFLFAVAWTVAMALVFFLSDVLVGGSSELSVPFTWLNSQTLFELPPMAAKIGYFCVMILVGIIMRGICVSQFVLPEKSNLPYLFVLFFAAINSQAAASPQAHVALLLLIVALSRLFSLHREGVWQPVVFNVGFLVAVAALFEPVYICLLLPFWFGLLVMNTPALRSFLILVLGVVTVGIIVASVCYLTDRFEPITQLFDASLWPLFAWPPFSIPLGRSVFYALLLVMLLIATVNFQAYRLAYNIPVRLRISALLFFLLITIGLWQFGGLFVALDGAIYLFSSVLLSLFFLMNKSRFALILFVVFAACGIASAFSPLFIL